MGVPDKALIYIGMSLCASLTAPCNSKPQSVQSHSGTYSAVLPPATQYSAETTPAEYTHQYAQQYTQVNTKDVDIKITETFLNISSGFEQQGWNHVELRIHAGPLLWGNLSWVNPSAKWHAKTKCIMVDGFICLSDSKSLHLLCVYRNNQSVSGVAPPPHLFLSLRFSPPSISHRSSHKCRIPLSPKHESESQIRQEWGKNPMFCNMLHSGDRWTCI